MDSPLVDLRQNGLVVRRRQRYDEKAWQGARSWLGGLPHIKLEDWPRHHLTRTPLYHLAQINFADLPVGPWSSYLPETGALCIFFDVDIIDENSSPTAVFVPDPDDCDPCQPPDDCQPLGGKDHWHNARVNRDRTRYEDAVRVMPKWPVDFVPVKYTETFPDDIRDVAFDPPLNTILGPNPDYVPTPLPEDTSDISGLCRTDEVPWEAARRVCVTVQNNAKFNPAVDVPSGLGAKLREIGGGARRRQASLHSFLDRWSPLIAQNDPYATMPQDQAKAFIDDIWELRKIKVISSKSWHNVTNLCDAGRDIYRDMLLGTREMYEKVPPQVRDRMQNDFRQSLSDGSHQIFGQGMDLQGYLDDWDSHLLLFQATYDDIMDWEWGDLGVIQFFITPQDLAARNWSGLKGYYTCG